MQCNLLHLVLPETLFFKTDLIFTVLRSYKMCNASLLNCHCRGQTDCVCTYDWMSVLLLLPAQVKEKCGWWEGLVHMRDVWRCCIMEPGGLCVVITGGTCRMPQSSVVNWAMAELWLHLMLMEEEVVQFGMMMCAAVAVKPASLSVPIVVLECITVTTVEMQE